MNETLLNFIAHLICDQIEQFGQINWFPETSMYFYQKHKK